MTKIVSDFSDISQLVYKIATNYIAIATQISVHYSINFMNTSKWYSY